MSTRVYQKAGQALKRVGCFKKPTFSMINPTSSLLSIIYYRWGESSIQFFIIHQGVITVLYNRKI